MRDDLASRFRAARAAEGRRPVQRRERKPVSSSMYWRPAPKEEPPAAELPIQLKKAIAQRLWGHDGSLNGDEIILDAGMQPYLDGMADAGVEGAKDLAKAIDLHGRVIVWISN